MNEEENKNKKFAANEIENLTKKKKNVFVPIIIGTDDLSSVSIYPLSTTVPFSL